MPRRSTLACSLLLGAASFATTALLLYVDTASAIFS